jgi:hypothetical protein
VHLDFLRPLFDAPGPWAAVYSGAPPTDESGAKERELAVRDLCRALAEEGADPATTEAVRDTLGGLAPADAPHGAAVFASGGRVAQWHALPRALPAPVVRWAALPYLVPLVVAYDPDPECLVARIDRTGADFERWDAGGRRPAGGTEGAGYPVHRTASADWSERHFQAKVENTWERNAGEIARALAGAARDCSADLIVLAGDPRERQEVFDRLPADVRERTTVSDHGGRAAGASSELLAQDVARARDALALRRDGDLLDRFLAGREQALADVPELVEAAREHRIDTLLLRPDGADLHREVWVGTGEDSLSARRTRDEPISARAADALLRSAVAADAEIAVVGADRRAPGPQDLRRSTDGEGDGENGSDGNDNAADALARRAEEALPGGLGALPRWAYDTGGQGSAG